MQIHLSNNKEPINKITSIDALPSKNQVLLVYLHFHIIMGEGTHH